MVSGTKLCLWRWVGRLSYPDGQHGERLLETMQHQGENALAVAKHFGNLDLTDLASTDDRIYFNLFGLLVHYPAKWAIPITVVFAAIWMAFAVLFARISRLSSREVC